MNFFINNQLEDNSLNFLFLQTQSLANVVEFNGLIRFQYFNKFFLLHLKQQLFLHCQIFGTFGFEGDPLVDTVELLDIMSFIGIEQSN